MKFFVVVKDSKNAILHNPGFKTLAEAQEHKILCEDPKNYPSFPLKKNILKAEVATIIPAVEAITEVVPEIPAVLDEAGLEITPAIPSYVKIISEAIPEIKIVQEPEEFEMVADYVVSIIDLSAEVEAKEVLEADKKLKKEQAELALKSFDINKIKDADVRQVIQFILDKIQGL